MAFYGIDLGTTNSLIGLHNDSSNEEVLSNMVPSVVGKKDGKAVIGVQAESDPEAWRNYKVEMQTSDSGTRAVTCSSMVLRELKKEFGLDVSKDIDAVISVPAYFSGDQCDATRNAANAAGINVISIIKEPVAAAIYLSRGQDGVYTIFDLGGGTLDVSVVKMEAGKATVLSTDGCILGGRDLDHAIGEFIRSKYNLPSSQIHKGYFAGMQKIKIERASSKENVTRHTLPFGIKTISGEVTVELTLMEYMRLVETTFDKALNIAKSAILASHMDVKDTHFLFVGGSTHCEYLRYWIAANLGVEEDDSVIYDRDIVVAQGVSYYAYLLSSGQASSVVQRASKLLGAVVDDNPFIKPLIYKNTGLPANSVTTALEVSEPGVHNIKIVYGDWSVFDSEDEGYNNDNIADISIDVGDNPKATAILVCSTLNEQGDLEVKLHMPLEQEVVVKERINL